MDEIDARRIPVNRRVHFLLALTLNSSNDVRRFSKDDSANNIILATVRACPHYFVAHNICRTVELDRRITGSLRHGSALVERSVRTDSIRARGSVVSRLRFVASLPDITASVVAGPTCSAGALRIHSNDNFHYPSQPNRPIAAGHQRR